MCEKKNRFRNNSANISVFYFTHNTPETEIKSFQPLKEFRNYIKSISMTLNIISIIIITIIIIIIT